MSATRGVIVQANPLDASGSVYPTQHNTTHARTHAKACMRREKDRQTERERVREGERHTRTHTRARAHTHTHTCTHTHTRVHAHTYIRVKRTHLHVGVSHSRKPVCDSVHVRAQAMNSINLGVKRWKEPSSLPSSANCPLWYSMQSLWDSTTHTPATSGPLSPFTVARLVCPKHWNPDDQVMHIALAPP